MNMNKAKTKTNYIHAKHTNKQQEKYHLQNIEYYDTRCVVIVGREREVIPFIARNM